MDFDETRLYYSHQALRRDDATWGANDENNEDVVKTSAVRRHFREFLRTFPIAFNAVMPIVVPETPHRHHLHYRQLPTGPESLHLS